MFCTMGQEVIVAIITSFAPFTIKVGWVICFRYAKRALHGTVSFASSEK
jgi:hypothetical protein